MQIRKAALRRSPTHTLMHIPTNVSVRSTPFCGGIIPQKALEQDKRSLTVFLTWFNIALASAFITICCY